MSVDFRILLVDDEETFLYSTTDLLRREGYECDCAPKVELACQLLGSKAYDLVIADINMPGNADLEFVQMLARSAAGVSVILATGHPSLASAIQSVELPVVAYLVKPFNLDELLAKVRSVTATARMRRAVSAELARLREYRQGLLHIDATVAAVGSGSHFPSLQAFVGLTLRNLVDGLSSLQSLAGPIDSSDAPIEGGRLPQELSREMRGVLRDAVATLERTKLAFKSKDLGELRKQLDALLNA